MRVHSNSPYCVHTHLLFRDCTDLVVSTARLEVHVDSRRYGLWRELDDSLESWLLRWVGKDTVEKTAILALLFNTDSTFSFLFFGHSIGVSCAVDVDTTLATKCRALM